MQPYSIDNKKSSQSLRSYSEDNSLWFGNLYQLPTLDNATNHLTQVVWICYYGVQVSAYLQHLFGLSYVWSHLRGMVAMVVSDNMLMDTNHNLYYSHKSMLKFMSVNKYFLSLLLFG